MKRLLKLLIVLVLAVMLIAAISLTADASELKTGIGTVTVGSLRLREGPSTDSAILATAYRGDNVIIIRQVGDWYLVSFNLKTGYMHKDYLEIDEKKNIKIGYAMFECVTNVRKGPSTSTGVVDQAPKGETCFIIGFNCGWFKVSYNGQIGYVRSDLVNMLEIPYYNANSPGNTYKEPAKGSAPAKTVSSTASASSTSSGGSKTTASSSGSSSGSTSASSSSSSSSSSSGSSSSSDLGERIAAYAQKYLGYRYVYGGKSPSTGFDCSGLVWYVAKQFGYTIGRTATAQLSAGSYVSRSNLKPGDIVLFNNTSASGKASHAGIYIGNGKFIHAANSRSGVIISSIDSDYFSRRFVCGRRLG